MNVGNDGEGGQRFQSAFRLVVTRATLPRPGVVTGAERTASVSRSARGLGNGGVHSSTAGPPGWDGEAVFSLTEARVNPSSFRGTVPRTARLGSVWMNC